MSVFRRIGRRIKLATGVLVRGSGPLPMLSPVLTQYPILIPLRDIYSKLSTMGNKYEVYRVFTEIDPELYGAIHRIALMVKKSYQGIGVAIGEKLEEKEEKLLRIVKDFEDRWDLPGLFYSVAFHLIRDGDDIYAVKFDDTLGLSEMQPLPISYVTILENENQMGDASAQIFKRNFYYFNEMSEPVGTAGGSQLHWPKDEIVHFALNNRAETIYDVMGRFTFGIWSLSPVEPLKARLFWKLATLINDIMMRQRLVPREHHKLDLSAFDPSFFAGETLADRIAAAKAAAVAHIESYKTDVTTPLKEVDKSYITGKETVIEFVEPQHVTYIDPNPLIDQISRSIMSTTGAPEAAVTGRGRGTYATEIAIASYAASAAEAVADIIKRTVLTLVRRAVRKKYKNEFTDEDLAKIGIRIQLLLGLEKGEASRRAAVMDATGIATLDELRSEAGLLRPLKEDERAQIIERRTQGRRIAERTRADIISDYLRRKGEPEPTTPESEHQRSST